MLLTSQGFDRGARTCSDRRTIDFHDWMGVASCGGAPETLLTSSEDFAVPLSTSQLCRFQVAPSRSRIKSPNLGLTQVAGEEATQIKALI